MKKALIAVGLLLAIVAAGYAYYWQTTIKPKEEAAAAEAALVSEAKTAVADLFKDPESARFRGIKIGALSTVCGEVNAKNGYGAYVGYEPFAYRPSHGDNTSQAKVYKQAELDASGPEGDLARIWYGLLGCGEWTKPEE